MSDEVRLIDRFIPAMDVFRYWDWQHGYTTVGPSDNQEKVLITEKPMPVWLRIGDIYGEVRLQDVADDKCLSVRQPCRIIRFYVKGASSEWCSDDPEVFALLAKLGIKPTPAEES